MLAAAATHNLNTFFPDLATDDFDEGKRDNLLFCFGFFGFVLVFFPAISCKSYRKGTFYFCFRWLASPLETRLLSLEGLDEAIPLKRAFCFSLCFFVLLERRLL